MTAGAATQLPHAALDEIALTGADPVLPVRYRVGHARHLRPVVQLSEIPGAWSRPPVPPGYHAPGWPPRGG